jgi:hypothetical protein
MPLAKIAAVPLRTWRRSVVTDISGVVSFFMVFLCKVKHLKSSGGEG